MVIKRSILFLLVYVFLNNVGQAQTKPSGEGTFSNPFQIEELDHLRWLAEDDSEFTDAERWGKYYQLIADIDASATNDGGQGFTPIGNSTDQFTGSFDGQAYVISNLYINKPSSNYIGLFGYIAAAGRVKNFGLTNVSIIGQNYVGAIAGRNEGTVKKVYSSGSVEGTNKTIGGIVGDNAVSGSLKRTYSSASVKGVKNVGGLIGGNFGSAVIEESYSTGAVDPTGTDIGGLVGKNNSSVAVSSSYWDIETSGLGTSAGLDETLYGLTTLEFADASNFSSWDFDSNWTLATYNIVDGSTTRPHIFMYTITVSQGENGEVSPSTVSLYKRASQTFSIIPDTNFEILELKVDGDVVPSDLSYTFSDIESDHTLEVTFYNPSGTLPVQLVYFGGKVVDENINLNWTTATETDNLSFTVERSTDGVNFKALGKINGQGNSLNIHEYTYTDQMPYMGDNFYRLKTTDFRNRIEYSSVIYIQHILEQHTLKIMPNPSYGKFKIIHSGVSNLQILNLEGQVIDELKDNTSNFIHIELADKYKGLFLIRYFFRGQFYTKKLVIN
ncbi:T9SS type A sorting domain-containing protein [Sediminitomix flava]|uniref:Putative secreted protein (Por secretion system target) n=1 Tax=Sediminitomix flava TaxID=379075 RepID=A0A315Z8N0_SEDFL|nr:T9SS type A sorting domain-containing protein [Sediminitomix flava]PWJ41925.1 putative secreted protein (Por secretion system target) [Sediminitomix flava]